MTVNIHRKGPKKGHIEMKEGAKYIGIRMRMNHYIFEKEMIEIKKNLGKLMEVLQESEEDQYRGWLLRRKKVRRNTLQLKHRQRSFSGLKKEELKGNEFEGKFMVEEEVAICELE